MPRFNTVATAMGARGAARSQFQVEGKEELDSNLVGMVRLGCLRPAGYCQTPGSLR